MTYLSFTESRIHEPAVERQLDHNGPNYAPNTYRFARTRAPRAGNFAAQAARGLGRFFRTMIALIAAAKIRRLAREMRMRGIRHDSARFDGDRLIAN